MSEDYNDGNNPCGFCEQNLHEDCDCKNCTCSCSYGEKSKKARKKLSDEYWEGRKI